MCVREKLTPETVKSPYGRKHGETERSPEGKCYDSRTHFNGYIIPRCCRIRAIAVNYYAMLLYSQWCRIWEVITAFCCVICCFIMAIELSQEAANDDYSELISPQYVSWLWLTFTIIVNAQTSNPENTAKNPSIVLQMIPKWNVKSAQANRHYHPNGILPNTTQLALRTGFAFGFALILISGSSIVVVASSWVSLIAWQLPMEARYTLRFPKGSLDH